MVASSGFITIVGVGDLRLAFVNLEMKQSGTNVEQAIVFLYLRPSEQPIFVVCDGGKCDFLS